MDPATFHYPEIFSGKVNPYQYFNLSENMQKSKCRYIYTLMYWSHVKHKNITIKSLDEEIQTCAPIIEADPYFKADDLYFVIETAFEFPPGRSFLNDPAYVSSVIQLPGETP